MAAYEYFEPREGGLVLVPEKLDDPVAYSEGLAQEASDYAVTTAALVAVPTPRLDIVAQDPTSPLHMHVKIPRVDLTDSGVLGAYFHDPDNPGTHFRLDNLSDRDRDYPGMVQADLEVIDHKDGIRITYRVRLESNLREAKDVAWDFIGDHSRFVKNVGGVATGAAVGVMTLYAIRRKRSHEK